MANQWLQGAIVGLMVLGAVAYLVRKYLSRNRKTAGRGGCGSCSGDCSRGPRHGRRRFDPDSGVLLRPGRAQADALQNPQRPGKI